MLAARASTAQAFDEMSVQPESLKQLQQLTAALLGTLTPLMVLLMAANGWLMLQHPGTGERLQAANGSGNPGMLQFGCKTDGLPCKYSNLAGAA